MPFLFSYLSFLELLIPWKMHWEVQGEMAQWIKCLLHKHVGQSSDSQYLRGRRLLGQRKLWVREWLGETPDINFGLVHIPTYLYAHTCIHMSIYMWTCICMSHTHKNVLKQNIFFVHTTIKVSKLWLYFFVLFLRQADRLLPPSQSSWTYSSLKSD